jgi:hypothetical protein
MKIRTTDDTERAKRRSVRITSLLHATATLATTVAFLWPLLDTGSKHPAALGD